MLFLFRTDILRDILSHLMIYPTIRDVLFETILDEDDDLKNFSSTFAKSALSFSISSAVNLG